MLQVHPGDTEFSYIANMSLLNLAEELRRQEKYEEALAMVGKVDPSFTNLKKLRQEILDQQKTQQVLDQYQLNSIRLEQGQKLFTEGKYLEALAVYQQVDAGFAGLAEAMTQLKEKMAAEAEFHYKEGVKYFVEEQLGTAIKEWTETLALDPDHQNARNSLEKAQSILEKVKEIN